MRWKRMWGVAILACGTIDVGFWGLVERDVKRLDHERHTQLNWARLINPECFARDFPFAHAAFRLFDYDPYDSSQTSQARRQHSQSALQAIRTNLYIGLVTLLLGAALVGMSRNKEGNPNQQMPVAGRPGSG